MRFSVTIFGLLLEPAIGYLIGKVDREGIKRNPSTSIVTRIILKDHSLFEAQVEPEFFIARDTNRYRTIYPELAPYTERHLRTTCGTMLAFCDGAEQYRADLRYVQYRLGHADLTMTVERYAEHAPTNSMSVENYCNLSALELEHKGEVVDVSG